MSQDPNCRQSELVSLRDHFERLLAEHEKREQMREEAMQRALQIQETNTLHWRESANEWRAAMDDRERNFLPRSIGYIVGILSVVSLVLTIYEVMHR